MRSDLHLVNLMFLPTLLDARIVGIRHIKLYLVHDVGIEARQLLDL